MVQGPGDSDLLGLPSGDLNAVLIVFVQIGVDPLRHLLQTLSKARLPDAFFHLLAVIAAVRRHIFPQGQGEQPEILKHHGEQFQILLLAEFPDVHPV